MKAEVEDEKEIEFEGYTQGSVIELILGVGVATMLLIFVGVLGGQAYSLTQSQINAINDTTVKQNIVDSITSGFSTLKLVGQYLPLIVLGVVISLVIGLVMSFARPTPVSGATAL